MGVLVMLTTTAEATDKSDSVLVFGGTGRLGAPIVHLLVDAGYRVTVFARPTSDRGRLDGLDVAYVTGDLVDAGSVTEGLAGQDFQFVVEASARGASRESFYDTAMRSILTALARRDVRQFILHGSVGAGDNMHQFPNVGFERMSKVMAAKGAAEAMLKDSGMAYTILRNGMIRPDGTPATGTARLTDDDSVLGTVTRVDLAALTLFCMDNQDCLNKTLHVVDDSFP